MELGTWIKRVKPEHECPLPCEREVGVGSVWRCFCGEQYELVRRHWIVGGRHWKRQYLPVM